MFLTRAQIMSVEDLPYEGLDVPEWAGSVRVRGLTGTERGIWEKTISSMDTSADGAKVDVTFDLSEMRVALCTLCMVDDQGARLFENHEVALLGQKSAAAIQRVYDVAARLSGIAKEAVEDAAKISGETDDAGTVSASA